MISGIRVLKIYSPTSGDLERVKSMAKCDCPRRYCWWWRSSGFDWELAPDQGCTFLQSKKHPDWKFADVPCKRAEPKSSIDHYEARDPELIQDDLPINYFRNPVVDGGNATDHSQ